MNSTSTILRRVLLAITFLLLVLAAAPTILLGQPAGEVVKPIQEKAHDKAYIIKVTGEVDDIMLRSIQRRSDIAIRGGASLIIYDIDSPGGIVYSCLEITRITRTQAVPVVAWVHPRAFSCAAMIALSCNQVVVAKDSKLGDCAPIAVNPDEGSVSPIPPTERAKFNSPVLEDFRASSVKTPTRAGFDPNLAYAMVEVEREVDRFTNKLTGEVKIVADPAEKQKLLNEEITPPDGKKIKPWLLDKDQIDGKNSLLIADAKEALEMKLAQAKVDNIEELRAVLNIRSEPVILDYTYAEHFARWLGQGWVRWLLFFLMLIFAWAEFSHPGTLFGGIAAMVCLVLLVAAPYMAGIAQAWEIGIIVLGLAIVIIDLVFAGGIGLAAIPGFLLMAVGIIGTFVPAEPGGGWIPHLPQTYAMLQQGMSAVIFGTIAAIGAFFIMAKYLYMTPGFRRLQLKPAQATAKVPIQDASEAPATDAVFAGALGRATTPLRPAGKARFGDHLIDVVTEGQFIDSGETIVVLEATTARVLVKPYTSQSTGSATGSP